MEIDVFADWEEVENAPALLGRLSIAHTKGHQVISFNYDKEWIKKGVAQDLDPDLQYYTGPQDFTRTN